MVLRVKSAWICGVD